MPNLVGGFNLKVRIVATDRPEQGSLGLGKLAFRARNEPRIGLRAKGIEPDLQGTEFEQAALRAAAEGRG